MELARTNGGLFVDGPGDGAEGVQGRAIGDGQDQLRGPMIRAAVARLVPDGCGSCRQVPAVAGEGQVDDGFIADLEGLSVYDQEGQLLGHLAEVLSMPKNDVYVVRGEKEYLIPAVKEYIRNTDIAAGRMDVTIIEGMQTDAD